MTRGVSWFFVGSFVLVALAGCGRGLFQTAEREPWRAEAELACLKSGAVREGADLVRINPISGPGVCGAEYPLKVAALGEAGGALSYNDELRPPAAMPSFQPRWSERPQPSNYSSQTARGEAPTSLYAPGIAPPDEEDEIAATLEGTPRGLPPLQAPMQPLPRLGPSTGNPVAAFGPVALKPAATLACPIVSVLDRWLADSVQPAAMRWFGNRVAEIKQISAYSCRGMNGNSRAHISEHAFGNALDIAAFVLADGRRVSVKEGWRGTPEEQGFLRDVQGAACQQFNTVLAPGSNAAHHDHIHVDLMRRSSRRVICQPAAVSGEEVASRASVRGPYAARDSGITGSIGRWLSSKKNMPASHDDYEED